MFCVFFTGAIFTQTGAVPSHQRPLQQQSEQSPWHTNVHYSWSLIRDRFLGLSPLLHTHDRLSPAALFQFLRPTTKTRRGCDIAFLLHQTLPFPPSHNVFRSTSAAVLTL